MLSMCSVKSQFCALTSISETPSQYCLSWPNAVGFLSMGHYKDTDYAVFFGAQTVQKPKKYDRPEATSNGICAFT